MTARKIAMSLPEDQFRAVERNRKKLGLNRSQALQQALELWLSRGEEDDRIARYVDGYRRLPEDAAEADAFVEAWASGLAAEDWE